MNQKNDKFSRRMIAMILGLLMLLQCCGLAEGLAPDASTALDAEASAGAETALAAEPVSVVDYSDSTTMLDAGMALPPVYLDGTLAYKGPDNTVKAAQGPTESSNLGDFLTKVTVSGASLENGSYVVQPNTPYDITMIFKETASLQFDNEETLTYQLPDGISFPAGNQKVITIAVVSGGQTYEVPATITTGENGTITVKFDETDPNYSKLASSTNVSFRVKIKAEITQTITKTEWSTLIDKDIILDTVDHSDVYAQKNGTFDPTSGRFTYTIKVTSDGNTEKIHVTDVISGNALIFNNDVQISGNSSSYTTNPLPSGQSGFDYTFASMADGEEITITYTASLNPAAVGENGKVTVDQTRNTVTVKKDGGDPHTAEYSREISLKNPGKSDGTETGTTADGDKLYNWTIEYNPLALVPAAKDVISDSIGTASRDYMKYYGNVTVKVYNHAGNLVDTRSFTPGSDYDWSYTVPEGDTTPYRYVFEYQTIVDQKAVDNHGQAIQLTNEVTGPGGKDSGTINTNPKEEIAITKEVESSNPREVTWVSHIHVPEGGLTQAIVTDTLPVIWSGSIELEGNFNLYDAYKDGSLQISGLLPGESWNPTFTSDKVVITFYKDAAKTQTGLQGTPGGHDITIRLTTMVDQRWLQYGYEHPDEKWKSTHTNEININTDTKAQAHVVFSKPGITKNGFVNGGYYFYTIVISGVTEEPLIVEDLFDTSLLEVAHVGTWNHLKIYGGEQYDQSSGETAVNYSDTPNGILITANSLPRQANGEFYPYYKITYYLELKDGVDLEELAAENNGQYDLTNTVFWGDHTSSYTFEIKYDFLNKELLQEATATNRHVKYRITYNLKKGELNGGEDVRMTDRLNENLSLDYTSIRIVTDPAGITVPYSISGDGAETVATYMIPDSTAVTIEYDAMVVGNGSINYKNTVEVKGAIKKVEKTTTINIESEGSGAVADLKITKVDGYDANKKLAGVRFKLYAADGRSLSRNENEKLPEVILVTDENGILHIDGTQYQIYLGSTPDESVKYYLEEVEAPDGYAVISFPYQFTLVDNMDAVDYEHYIYFFSDSFQIKNWPLEGLVVEKQVESPEAGDKEQYYRFRISVLNDDGSVNTGFNEKIGDDTFENGVFEFELKDKEQKMFKGFRKGTKYRVEEIDSKGLAVSVSYKVYGEDGSVTEVTDDGNQHTGAMVREDEVIVFTNRKTEGALKITKEVTVDDLKNHTSSLTDGTYTFSIAGIADTPTAGISHTVSITFKDGQATSYRIDNGTSQAVSGTDNTWSVVVPKLIPGRYTVSETGSGNLTLVSVTGGSSVSGNVATVVVTDKDTQAETAAAQVVFTNNIETTTVRVLKVWEHGSNTNPPSSLVVSLSNGESRTLNESNGWSATISGLPKYDPSTGDPIAYSWTEESLPAGYYLSNISESTDAATGIITTTLTNTFTDHYVPVTTIQGVKIWEDDGDKGRPVSITVNLYRDGGTEPYRTVTVTKSSIEGADPDRWPFEFTNLPIFNDDGSVIQYTVEENVTDEFGAVYAVNTVFSTATYIAGDAAGRIVNSGQGSQTFELCDGTDLGWIVIRHGNDFVVWTPRTATEAEKAMIKTKVVDLSNQFSGIRTASGNSMRYIHGVPMTIDVGNKQAVSVYMNGTKVMMKFLKPNAWSDFAYGTIPYTYTQAGGEGGGTITNIRKVIDISVTKAWKDGQEALEWPDDIASVTVGLYYKDSTMAAAAPYPDAANQMTVTITEDKPTKKFEDLPKYDSTGALIEYSVREESVTLADNTVQPREGNIIQIIGTGAQSWSVNDGTVANNAVTVTNTPVKTDFDIEKVDAEDGNKKLTGAVFKLEKLNADGTTWTVVIESIAVNDAGHADVDGLTDGTYRLTETTAPAGYVMLSGPISFTVAKGQVDYDNGSGGIVRYEKAEGAITGVFTIGNTPGVELPATGGPGTLGYTIAGLALVMAAGAVLLSRKKRKNNG